ncbi:hypothetical protein BCR43DRAFT_133960 [Syncephalastrum racemosum]|uniref:Lethal giant larvae (Lgl)-like C-terminal domain-containing protein n=1 Tax=Syncephalastrum racemosum TaxID=13706 RepID=A0A1X2HLP5_SYNRA|nr:hypothetical protein BCR43DRAFT_133960 [Syncephalastrum racemosum]
MEYPTPQLFIGYENGSLYQYDLSSTEERYGSEHDRALDLPFGKPILDLLLFNVEDAPQQTSPTGEETIPSHQDSGENTGRKSQDSKEDDGASGKSSDKSLSLLRKTTRKFSVKQKGRKLDRDGAPPLPGSVHDEAAVGAQDEETGRSGSKRVHAKVDYQPQADPHLLVMVTPVLVSVFLSGCAVRLFQLDLQEVMGNDRVVVSRIAKIQTIVCLVTVMQSGAILVNALPTLEPIAKVNLPAEYLLREVSLSGDGRVTAWSARFELQQILVLLQNEIPNGESVMLHDNQIRIPPHPTAVAAETAQKTKKSWLDTVQTAFQKGPVTVPELNTLCK